MAYKLESPGDHPGVNWGVIILTGVAALILVVAGGLLVRQMGDAFGEAAPPASPAPTPTLTPIPAVLALLVEHEGYWVVQVEVKPPLYEAGRARVYENRGSGVPIVPPTYEAPFGSRTTTLITYEIVALAPDLQHGGMVPDVQPRRLADLAGYLNVLPKKHYALYDADNRFMGIYDESEIANIPGLQFGEP